MKEQVKKKMM
jgi:hypothetical protein